MRDTGGKIERLVEGRSQANIFRLQLTEVFGSNCSSSPVGECGFVLRELDFNSSGSWGASAASVAQDSCTLALALAATAGSVIGTVVGVQPPGFLKDAPTRAVEP